MNKINICHHFLFLSLSKKCSLDGKENSVEVILRLLIIGSFSNASLLKSAYHKHLMLPFLLSDFEAQINDLLAGFTER